MYIWQQGKFNMIYGLKIKYKRLHKLGITARPKVMLGPVQVAIFHTNLRALLLL